MNLFFAFLINPDREDNFSQMINLLSLLLNKYVEIYTNIEEDMENKEEKSKKCLLNSPILSSFKNYVNYFKDIMEE